MNTETMPTILRYFADPVAVKSEPGYWNTLVVSVMAEMSDGTTSKIGEYPRNYHCMYDTFCPFRQGDEWFALYSTDYTATRVMALPSCEDLGGEERDGAGFCPVSFWVGTPGTEEAFGREEEWPGTWGLIAGCVWGDDDSWKVMHLDLTNAAQGVVVRDQRFGFVEMERGETNCLRDVIVDAAIDSYGGPWVRMRTVQTLAVRAASEDVP